MTSIIKVNNIQNSSGTSALTIDSSGRVTRPQLIAFTAYSNILSNNNIANVLKLYADIVLFRINKCLGCLCMHI